LNTPQFINVNNGTYRVLERIGNVTLEGFPISATDDDRCWYGNGRVRFRTSSNEDLFLVDGGDNITEIGGENNICKASPLHSTENFSDPCLVEISVYKSDDSGSWIKFSNI
jgi:hypothetical protein